MQIDSTCINPDFLAAEHHPHVFVLSRLSFASRGCLLLGDERLVCTPGGGSVISRQMTLTKCDVKDPSWSKISFDLHIVDLSIEYLVSLSGQMQLPVRSTV